MLRPRFQDQNTPQFRTEHGTSLDFLVVKLLHLTLEFVIEVNDDATVINLILGVAGIDRFVLGKVNVESAMSYGDVRWT